MQSRKISFVESLTNMLLGIVISYLAWRFVIVPVSAKLGWGFYETRVDAITAVNGFFTLLSLVRSYVVRRVFNSFERKKKQ